MAVRALIRNGRIDNMIVVEPQDEQLIASALQGECVDAGKLPASIGEEWDGEANVACRHVEELREWQPGAYEDGDIVQFDGEPFRCVSAHDSTDVPDVTPDTSISEWKAYHPTKPELARKFHKPGKPNAYQAGEYARLGDTVYRCTRKDTIASPGEKPGSWEAAQ